MSTKPSTSGDEESQASSDSFSYSAAYSPTTPVSPIKNDDEEDDSETTVKIDEMLQSVHSDRMIQAMRDDASVDPVLLERIERRQAEMRDEVRFKVYLNSPPIRESNDDDQSERSEDADEAVVESVKRIESMAQQIQVTRKNPADLKTPRSLPPAAVSFSPVMSYHESPYSIRPTGYGSSNGEIEYRVVGPDVPHTSSQYYDPSSMTFLAPPQVQFPVPLDMTYEMRCDKKFREINTLSKEDSDVNKGTAMRCRTTELAAKNINLKGSLPSGADEQTGASHLIDGYVRLKATQYPITENVEYDFDLRDANNAKNVAWLNKVTKDDLRGRSEALQATEQELEDAIDNAAHIEVHAKMKMQEKLEKEFVDYRLKDMKHFTPKQFSLRYTRELERRERDVERQCAVTLMKKEKELAAMKYKKGKIRTGLATCRHNELLMESYNNYLQVLVGEVLDIVRMYPGMVIKLSQPTIHLASGRLSQNPIADQSLPHIMQRLIEEYQQVSFTTFILTLLKQLGALTSAQIAANPLLPYEQSIEFTTQMITNGSFKYLSSADMIRTLLVLAKMIHAPTHIINEVCHIINVHEKKVRTNPNFKPTELALSSEIGEYLKTLHLSKAYSKSVPKEVIDLTPSPRTFVHKQPIRIHSAYAAQENPKKKATGIYNGVVGIDAKIEYVLKSGKKVTYLALNTAKDVCGNCYNDALPASWCKPRHYCRRCELCGLYGHSAGFCQQRI